ncbi:MAG: PD-(D/E)XK nuclease family protein [Thermodesulfovibrionales bacterium]|nr:PD-(D/E)XK nuclease family protein [Thermodesulfovibrionales bacterium]
MTTILQNIIAVHPEDDIIDKIIENLMMDSDDYSKNIIIFPNKRPAHFLRKRLALVSNSPILPPLIFAIDDFIDFLYEKRYTDIKIDSLDAIPILYNIHKNSPTSIGRDSFIDFDSFLPIGLKIFNDIEELYIEKISINDVKNIDQLLNGIPLTTFSRLQSLSYFYENFYSIIQQSGYSTRSLRYRRATEIIKELNFGDLSKIILAGFFALTKSEVELFKTILSRGNSLLIFKDSPAIQGYLKELNISYKSSFDLSKRKTEIRFYSSPDSHGQIFCLSKILKDKLDKGLSPDEKTLILLPSSENLFPLIYNCLSLFGKDSFNISLGYPLHRTPIFSFFNNLMELVITMTNGKFYIPAYLKFALHPYIKNIYFENQSELTRIIFHALDEELSRNRAIIFMTLEEIENSSQFLQTIDDLVGRITKEDIRKHLKEIHEKTICKFLSFENIGDFAKKCSEILLYIYNNSTAKLHPLFHPYSEAFLETFNRISTSLLKDLSFLDINGYFIFFKNYILTCNVPFEGVPISGIQVLGFLEARNLNFESIYILDLNEETLPSIQKDTTFIPFGVRNILGLPTYLETEKIYEYYFDILVRGAKEAHLFFIENNAKERSRFVEKILWEVQKTEKNLFNPIKTIQYRVTLKNQSTPEINKTDKIINLLKNFTFTASSLDSYLKCALSFYYKYILKIEKKIEVTGDIEKSDIGVFIHEFLYNFFKRFKGQRLTEEKIDIKKIDLLYERLFEKKFGKNPSGSIYLIKEQINKHLKEILEKYYHCLSKSTHLKILECEHDISIRIDSYNLKGRIDIIEERDGKEVIVDYKISADEDLYRIDFKKIDPGNRKSWQKAIGSLQLPFYIMLYLQSKKGEPTNIDAMFLLLGKNVINEGIELSFSDGDNNIKQRYEIARYVIFKLLEEILNVNVPFMPSIEPEKTCIYCDYKNICGTQ